MFFLAISSGGMTMVVLGVLLLLAVFIFRKKRLVGFHKHKCDYCQYIWKHSNNCFGNIEAHTCPRCSKLQWFRYTGLKPPTTKQNPS